MKLLLDSHAFLWLMATPERVSAAVLKACSDTANSLHLSVASIWELQVKEGRGRLSLDLPLQSIVESQVRDNAMSVLNIERAHIWMSGKLPHLHGDPFDRMLVAQARIEGMKLVTADKDMKRYEVETLW
jgi:PIN domain nuclease of toxin-antitoxin system